MKLLTYSGRGAITDERAAQAVLDYAIELALVQRSDVVSVPAVTAEGLPEEPVDMLIGPGQSALVRTN
ncbi:hypothetical protein [Amnibacterium flavum]|nr:hypothetical protein [Amnibacterium flavum]